MTASPSSPSSQSPSPSPPLKLPPRPRLLSSLPYLLILLLPLLVLLLTNHLSPHPFHLPPPAPRPPPLPRCSHILLFSAPRHGSTWFIDSADRCRYSARPARASAKNGAVITYSRDANKNSELWNPAQRGPLRNISAESVPDFIRTNGSVKVFPIVMESARHDVARFLNLVKERDFKEGRVTPVVVLTRRLEDAHRSLVAAQETHVWNKLPNATDAVPEMEQERKDVAKAHGQRFRNYRNRNLKFFEAARDVLSEVAMPGVEEFEYEAVRGLRFIEVEKAGCYIANCNFQAGNG